jgi:hypothetical protein
MSKNVSSIVTGLYDLLLAGFAIWGGVLMISAVQVFSEFPAEWVGKLPFDSWQPVGIVGIVVFGLSNIAAALHCFTKRTRTAAILSAILACLLIAVIFVVFGLTGQTYLPGNLMLIAGVLQLGLSIWLGFSKNLKEGNSK